MLLPADPGGGGSMKDAESCESTQVPMSSANTGGVTSDTAGEMRPLLELRPLVRNSGSQLGGRHCFLWGAAPGGEKLMLSSMRPARVLRNYCLCCIRLVSAMLPIRQRCSRCPVPVQGSGTLSWMRRPCRPVRGALRSSSPTPTQHPAYSPIVSGPYGGEAETRGRRQAEQGCGCGKALRGWRVGSPQSDNGASPRRPI